MKQHDAKQISEYDWGRRYKVCFHFLSIFLDSQEHQQMHFNHHSFPLWALLSVPEQRISTHVVRALLSLMGIWFLILFTPSSVITQLREKYRHHMRHAKCLTLEYFMIIRVKFSVDLQNWKLKENLSGIYLEFKCTYMKYNYSIHFKGGSFN